MPRYSKAFTGLAVLLGALLLTLMPAGAAEDSANYVEIPAAVEVPLAGESEPAAPAPEEAAGSDLPAGSADSMAAEVTGIQNMLDADLTEPGLALPGPQLSLAEALTRAIDDNPELAAFDYEQRAAQARRVQAGLLPNPEIQAEVSEFMGTAEMRFLRSAVTSVGVSQLVERSCKRLARCAVAEREGGVAQAELERARLDLMLAVTEAYSVALVAQQRLALSQRLERLLQQVYDLVALRVEGGKAARLELTRTEIELLNTRLERENRERELGAAMASLAAFWEGEPAEFTHVEGRLELPSEVPGVQQLQALLDQTPDAQRWDAEAELRQARLNLAAAEARPDFTISGGLARFEETDSFGFNLGISFPLRRHNRNEGSIMEAQEYLNQVDSLREADLRRQRQALTEDYARLSAAHELATAIESELLPAARESFELTELGYRYGKFTLLDVLDSQRVLIEARSAQLNALAEYQLASVRLERLVAMPLADLASGFDYSDETTINTEVDSHE